MTYNPAISLAVFAAEKSVREHIRDGHTSTPRTMIVPKAQEHMVFV